MLMTQSFGIGLDRELNQKMKLDTRLGSRTLNSDEVEAKNAETFKAAQKFEGLLVSMMVKEMRKTVHKSGLLDGGQAQEIFTEMLDNQYADNISKRGGFGLAKAMFNQMKIKTESDNATETVQRSVDLKA